MKTKDIKEKLNFEFRRLGYYEGRLAELKNNRVFISKNWWIDFLLGIAWGLIIAEYVIIILK